MATLSRKDKTMILSIVLCTYNQSKSLRIVLECLARQTLDNFNEVELLVIDNNSSDDTKSVVYEVAKSIKFTTRYIFEEQQGLSLARNRGVREAKANFIVFTDDDAEIPKNWAQTYIKNVKELNPDCVFGKIDIIWDKPKPFWYSDEYKSMFVGLDYGEKRIKIKDLNHEFFGKNFGVRKNVLEKIGLFDEKLGRKGEQLFIGEETKVYRSLIKDRSVVIYDPEIIVGHMLKEKEYSLAHFYKYNKDKTTSEYSLYKSSSKRSFYGRPIYAIRKSLHYFLFAFPKHTFLCLLNPNSKRNIYVKSQILRHFRLAALFIKG